MRIVAENPALPLAASLVTVDGAQIFNDITTGTPAQVVNVLDPAVAGNLLGFFTQGGTTLDLDAEILPASTAVATSSSPTVDINFSGQFLLQMTIQESGASLNVDAANCTFDNPAPHTGAPIQLPVVSP
jgi:hypothetical protein